MKTSYILKHQKLPKTFLFRNGWSIILKSLIGMTSLVIYVVYRVGSLFILMCGGSKGIYVDVERVNVLVHYVAEELSQLSPTVLYIHTPVSITPHQSP